MSLALLLRLVLVLSVGASVSLACGGEDERASSRSSTGLLQAVESRDAGALVASMGGETNDHDARAAAESLFAALPNGTTMRLVEGSPDGPRATYEVSIPGTPPRMVSFLRVTTGDGERFLLPAEGAR